MRYYALSDELVSPEAPWFDLEIDPKLGWALAHLINFRRDHGCPPEILTSAGIGLPAHEELLLQEDGLAHLLMI